MLEPDEKRSSPLRPNCSTRSLDWSRRSVRVVVATLPVCDRDQLLRSRGECALVAIPKRILEAIQLRRVGAGRPKEVAVRIPIERVGRVHFVAQVALVSPRSMEARSLTNQILLAACHGLIETPIAVDDECVVENERVREMLLDCTRERAPMRGGPRVHGTHLLEVLYLR